MKITRKSKITASVDSRRDPYTVEEILDFLWEKGFDVDSDEVKNYADAVEEYMDLSYDAWTGQDDPHFYTLDEWYEDTKRNYPEELDELPIY